VYSQEFQCFVLYGDGSFEHRCHVGMWKRSNNIKTLVCSVERLPFQDAPEQVRLIHLALVEPFCYGYMYRTLSRRYGRAMLTVFPPLKTKYDSLVATLFRKITPIPPPPLTINQSITRTSAQAVTKDLAAIVSGFDRNLERHHKI